MKLISLLLIAILAMPASAFAQAKDRWWADGAILASGVAAAADLSTTSYNRGKFPTTFREANLILRPFANDPVALAVVKGSMDGVTIWILIKQHKKHPKLVTGIAIAKTIVSGFVAHSNAKQAGLR